MRPFDPARLDRLDAIFEEAVAAGRIPGAVVAVTSPTDNLYLKSFGYRDREAGIVMTDDTIFRTASMTKPVVAATALMLADEGRLHLDSPVGRYLPELSDLKLGVETDDPAGRRLVLTSTVQPTILDLLRQTAGFTNVGAGTSMVHAAYAGIPDLRDHRQTNAEMVEKLARLPLLYRPGTAFEYGMSMDVLGRIIEVVAGADLNRVVAERVGEPLGMANSGFLVGDETLLAEPQADPTTGVRPNLGYQEGEPPRWFRGGGGLLSTAPDYARFCRLLLNRGTVAGQPLLSPATVNRMMTNALPPDIVLAPSASRLGLMAPDPALGQGFGLGGMVRTIGDRHPWPGNAGDYSWSGRTGTYFWVDPVDRFAAVLMMQTDTGSAFHGVLRNAVYGALA